MAKLAGSSESGFLHFAFGGWREEWQDVLAMKRPMTAMSELGSERDHVLEKGLLKWGESVAALLMPTVLRVWCEDTQLALQAKMKANHAAE